MSQKTDFGFIWMSVPKNYRCVLQICATTIERLMVSRESLDDGSFTGLLLGPLIASALLFSALQPTYSQGPVLPQGWRIEAPAELQGSDVTYSAHEALILSRYSLVDLGTCCSAIFMFHICASWWLEARYRKAGDSPEGERASVPRSERLRTWYYVLFTVCVSTGAMMLKVWLKLMGYKIWYRM
jgi:dolichol kinase